MLETDINLHSQKWINSIIDKQSAAYLLSVFSNWQFSLSSVILMWGIFNLIQIFIQQILIWHLLSTLYVHAQVGARVHVSSQSALKADSQHSARVESVMRYF